MKNSGKRGDLSLKNAQRGIVEIVHYRESKGFFKKHLHANYMRAILKAQQRDD